MPTRITIATYDEKHKQNLAKRAKKVSDLYDAAVKRLTQAAAPSLFDADNKEQEFHFEDFPALKREMDALMQDLYSSLQTNIEDGDEESWTLANTKNDAMVESVIGKAKLPKQTVQAWKHPHLEALNAFIDRKEAGMGLSKRVWNLTQQFKDEMELALELGMGEGKSAAELSRDIRKYLKEPNKLFRRVRDKSGALRLSKAAAAYHPGRGVYRSSYKNALRMTATENNMAYRTADHTRWQALPFVLGIEVRISNNHPIPDICDELAGRYPVEFKFTGWHPWCRCYAVSILAKQEEMDAYTKALIAGEDVSEWQFTGKVEQMPTEFTKWMKDNESRIAKAKSMPYFIKDNFKDGDPTKGLRWEGKTPDQEKEPAKTKYGNIPGNQKEQIAEFGSMDKKEAIKEIMAQAKVDADMADFMYESIQDFSFGAYQDMRTVQMGGADIWDLRYSVKEWKKRVEACEEFIEKSPKWNGGSTYRGMHVSEEQMQALLNKMEKKEPIDMQGIASWSTSKDIALGYTYPNPKTPIRVILETDDAQNGTSIAHISIHPGEHEILCSVRNKYLIKEITKEQAAGYDYYKVKVENTAQLNQPAIIKKPTAKEIAAKRHAARTKEQVADIQHRAELRQQKHAMMRQTALDAQTAGKEMPEVSTAALTKAINSGNLDKMLIAAKNVQSKVNKMKQAETNLEDLIPNVHEWHKKHTIKELATAHEAIKKTFDRWTWDFTTDNSLHFLQGRLQREIGIVVRSSHSTKEVAKEAFENRLKLVNKRIDMKAIGDSITHELDFAAKTKSAIVKRLGNWIKATLNDNNADIAILRTKAKELQDKVGKLEAQAAARAAKKAGNATHTQSKAEIIQEMKDAFLKRGKKLTDSEIQIENGLCIINAEQHEFMAEHMMNITREQSKQIWNHRYGYIQTSSSFTINGCCRDITGAGKHAIHGSIINNPNIDKCADLFGDKLSDGQKNTIMALDAVIGNNKTEFPMLVIRNVDSDAIKALFKGIDMDGCNVPQICNKITQSTAPAITPDCGYLSVSTNATKNVFTGRRFQLQLEVPKGAQMYVTDNYNESECILGRETKLALISAKVETRGGDDYGIIRCRVIP